MTDKNCCLLMSSCDAYSDLWHPFFFYLKKNWPEFNLKTYIITESKDFEYPGIDITVLHCNSQRWSERQMFALKEIKEDFVIYMLDDFWINQPVDDSMITKLYGYIVNDSRMGYLSFVRHCTPDSRKVVVKHSKPCKYPELRESVKGMPYRINTQAGLWRRKFFLKTFKKHENAWQYERRSNMRVRFLPEKVYSVNGPIDAISYPGGGVLWRGQTHISMKSYDIELFNRMVEKRGIYEEGKLVSVKSKKDFCWLINLVKSYIPNF